MKSCGVFTDVTSSNTRNKPRISCHSDCNPYIVCRKYRAMNRVLYIMLIILRIIGVLGNLRIFQE